MSMARIKQRPILLTRPKSRRAKHGLRTQFGALCWRKQKGEVEVLLITSRRTKRWILPKGWPLHGETPAASAANEAWEEAGVTGKITPVCLGIYSYTKSKGSIDALPCVVAVFPLEVKSTSSRWPEAKQRRRKWIRPKKAAAMVAEPELARILRSFDPANLPV